jgi:flagellar basal-body rod protein FlgF
MDRAIYTALGGANAALNRQAITSNNLANVSTNGFQAQLTAYRAVPVVGPSDQTRTLVVESTPGVDSTIGLINATGRDLDVALPQNGWLAVEMPDGTEAYTRNGNIVIDSEGGLRVSGLPLVGDGGAITAPPQAALTIAPDGTITSRGAGDEPSALAQIGRIKISSAEAASLVRGDDGFFRVADNAAEPLAADHDLRLMPGVLESSNVSPVKSMVDMIATARGFDMHMKVISSVDNNEKSANQLLSAG